jgi:2-(1,2-epoxy-1,2-dihydrophenyl)acetyl-CoA isomerase
MRTGQLKGFSVTLDDDGIALIQLNEPEAMPLLPRAATRDLIETLLQAQMDDRVRVIVFTGSGRAFAAGDDLSSERQNAAQPVLVDQLPYDGSYPIRTYESLRSCSQLLNQTLRHITKITIAAVNGFAIQSGLSLALCCDFRIAAESAKLGSATLRYGYLPDEGGHWLLVNALGEAQALDFILRKRIVSADDALGLGLVTEVVPDDALMDTAMTLAREFATGPQVALRLAKRAVRNATVMSFEMALDDIATKTAVGDHHADAREGLASFREHRPPNFNAWLDDAATT